MPKEFEVSGTVYEFPDNFTDDQVKGILSKKGIIKLTAPPKPNTFQRFSQSIGESQPISVEHPTKEQFVEQAQPKSRIKEIGSMLAPGPGNYGPGNPLNLVHAIPGVGPGVAQALSEMNPEKWPEALGHVIGTGATGAPVGPSMATGYPRVVPQGPDVVSGLKRAGGAIVNTAADPMVGGSVGAVVGALKGHPLEGAAAGVGTSKLIGKMRDVFGGKKPVSEAAKPGKGTSTKYGGPADPGYSSPTAPIPRKGYTPPPPPGPGKGTGVKYGGLTEPEYGPPGKTIPRKGFTPPEELPTSPTPPGKGTRTKYGGSYDPLSRSGGTRPMPKMRGPTARKAASEASAKSTETAAGPSELESKLEQSISKQRSDIVRKVVNTLKSHGIDQDLAERATPAQRKDFARQADVSHISDLAWDQILDELGGKSWPTKPLPPTRYNK